MRPTPDAAILLAAPLKGLTDATGAAEPEGVAVPAGAVVGDCTGGAAGPVLLEKIGLAGAGMTGAAVVATSAGLVATGELATGVMLTTGAAVGAMAGEVETGLVTVQGQLVIVRVVAWRTMS